MDINLLLQLLLQAPGVRGMVDTLWNSTTGGNPMGFTPLSYDPTKTLGTNYYNDRRASEQQAMFGFAAQQATQYAGQAAARGFYELMGYSSKDAAKRATEGSPVQDLITSLLVTPQASAAAGSMMSALYNRRNQWDSRSNLLGTNVAVSPAAAADYAQQGSALIGSVIQQAVDGGYSGIGVADTGKIAAQMIGVGAFDQRGGEKQDARVKRFSRELTDYANSITTLQDVIEGPVERIMDSFEKLTGSKLVSTSTGRVNAISQGIRNVLSQGVVSESQLLNMANTQYSMIAPYGGTRMMATSQALVNAAAYSSGVRVEGLNEEDFNVAQAKLNARMLANGTARDTGAAYAYWLSQNPERKDDQFARADFADEMRKINGDFNAAAREYLNKNNVSAAFRNSALANSAMNNPELIALSRESALRGYDTGLEAIGQRYNFDISKLDGVYDPGEIQTILSKELKDPNVGAAAQREIVALAQRTTGERDAASAMGLVGTAKGAVRVLEENRAAALWGTLNGKDGYVQGKGIEGVIAALQRKGYGKADIGSALGGFFGMDERVLRSAANTAISENRDVAAATRQAIMKHTGMSESQVDEYIDLASKHQGAARVISHTKAVDTSRAAVKQRMKLMELASKGKLTESDIAGMDKLQVSDDDRDRLLIASELKRTGNITATDKEVSEYQKVKAAQKAQGLDDEDAAKVAMAQLQAKKRVEEIRTEKAAQGRRATVEDFEKDEKLQEYQRKAKKAGDKDADTFISRMSEDNTVEGLLRSLVDLVRQLVQK